ncbi:MAG: L-lactate permease [Bacteroidales bacterium]|nr:L-lactate permease [Bacteroidales bacterium]
MAIRSVCRCLFYHPIFNNSFLLGPEFPSLIGGLISLIILMFTTKAGFLVPKEVWDFSRKK